MQLKLIKIGARVVRHASAINFPLAEVAISGMLLRAIRAATRRSGALPAMQWSMLRASFPNENGSIALPACRVCGATDASRRSVRPDIAVLARSTGVAPPTLGPKLLPEAAQEGSITLIKLHLGYVGLEGPCQHDDYRPECLGVESIAAIEASYRIVD